MAGTTRKAGKAMTMKMSPIGKLKHRHNNGFTLFELLIVISILALFMGLVTLRIDGVLSGGDLREAGRMLTGEITYLRAQAAYTHKECSLKFELDKNELYAIEIADPSINNDQKEQKDSAPVRTTIKLPDGVKVEDVVIFPTGKIQDGEADITFYINGCVDRSLIHLRNENDKAITLEVNPLTGSVIIHDTYIDQQ
jgi:prepilin-type N-terminal cleavage/methylation domain-containing protein